MVRTEGGTWRQKLVVGLLFSTMVMSGLWQSPATADVTEVTGLAFNYYTDVSLFDGPSQVRGFGQDATAPETAASPSVTCPEGGGTDTATDSDGARAVYGPATIFGGIWPEESNVAPPSGPLTSSIDCQLGPGGYVTADTSVVLMPPGSTWTTPGSGVVAPHPGGLGPGPLIADEAHSTCTADESGVSGSATFVNGILETAYDPDTQMPTETEPIPDNPEVNYTREGTIDHVGDSYRIVFNEQTTNADGSLTVVAAHMYLLGPTAVGDMVVGSVTCGITSDGTGGTTTTLGDGTTTTLGDGTTTTTAGDGTTTTTVGDGTTTTTVGDGTTTTTVVDPGDSDCPEPTDFVGQLIFQVFREISALLTSLGISGFEDFGCDLNGDGSSLPRTGA